MRFIKYCAYVYIKIYISKDILHTFQKKKIYIRFRKHHATFGTKKILATFGGSAYRSLGHSVFQPLCRGTLLTLVCREILSGVPWEIIQFRLFPTKDMQTPPPLEVAIFT